MNEVARLKELMAIVPQGTWFDTGRDSWDYARIVAGVEEGTHLGLLRDPGNGEFVLGAQGEFFEAADGVIEYIILLHNLAPKIIRLLEKDPL